ncbi:tRNA (adenosine(37)-N6)-threonylcarbamoyltransferase complex ATPase subunit type 1 TsaE [Tepidicaulis sp.]|uniref:tRNA (adenosine(37)-N6)-threonylcarbamoyltransferase complex ATPase subunit type 1 TsaE n=1 Tax=Tepidicaulis sp. TaxID=1920809 RepID=UPI003B5A7D84
MMDEQVILPDMTGAYEAALPDEAATMALGRALAGLVQPGDLIALWGDLGMGKSVLARALIQEAQRRAGGEAEDVPSPTFTLVQTYEAGGLSLTHFDLYRIGAPDEIYELGLDEALETGAALIEWPGRLEDLLPEERLDILIEERDKERAACLKGPARLIEGVRAALGEKRPAGEK